jgi:hypothetical protein
MLKSDVYLLAEFWRKQAAMPRRKPFKRRLEFYGESV